MVVGQSPGGDYRNSLLRTLSHHATHNEEIPLSHLQRKFRPSFVPNWPNGCMVGITIIEGVQRVTHYSTCVEPLSRQNTQPSSLRVEPTRCLNRSHPLTAHSFKRKSGVEISAQSPQKRWLIHTHEDTLAHLLKSAKGLSFRKLTQIWPRRIIGGRRLRTKIKAVRCRWRFSFIRGLKVGPSRWRVIPPACAHPKIADSPLLLGES
jgi:hypothetical protein